MSDEPPIELPRENSAAGREFVDLTITVDLDANPWSDLQDKPVVEARLTRLGIMPRGMASGRPAVMLLVEMGDGTQVLVQTSARIIATTGSILETLYPETMR